MTTMIETAKATAQNLAAVSGLNDADWQILQQQHTVTTHWDDVLSQSFGEAIRDGSTAPGAPAQVVDETRMQAFGVWMGSVLSGDPGDTFWPETYLMGLDYVAAGYSGPLLIAMENRVETKFLEQAQQALNPEEAMTLFMSFKRVFSTAVSVMADCSTHVASIGMKKVGVNERLFDNIVDMAIKSEIEDARAALPLIEWNASLSVGIESIDGQHKKLVGLLNRLHDSSVTGKSAETLRFILGELVEYTKTHFAFEEQLMAEHGYPASAAHIGAHQHLAEQVIEFNTAFQNGKTKLSNDLFNFLRNWLNGHIRGADRKYAPFFKQKGVN